MSIAVWLPFPMSRKTIICDAEPEDGGDKRRLVSFVGGLDLTNGRFDTPTHSLFRSLATTHRPPDFHQACVTVGPTKGPREPWHDQAGHVSAGAASWDVLQNFTERWRRQAGDEEHALVDISGRRYVSAEEEEEAGRHRQDAWNVQILRSINEASAMFEDNNSPGLFTRRRALIDQSIHHAYIHHVRRSKKFLFFENQYCTLLGLLWLGVFAMLPLLQVTFLCIRLLVSARSRLDWPLTAAVHLFLYLRSFAPPFGYLLALVHFFRAGLEHPLAGEQERVGGPPAAGRNRDARRPCDHCARAVSRVHHDPPLPRGAPRVWVCARDPGIPVPDVCDDVPGSGPSHLRGRHRRGAARPPLLLLLRHSRDGARVGGGRRRRV